IESWSGYALCEQRERPFSRVGVVLKRSTQEKCLQARRPSFCKKISRVATPLLATLASPRNLPLRILSVRRSTIRCLSCSPLWFRSGRKRLPHHRRSCKLSGKSSGPSQHRFSKRKEDGHDTPLHTHSSSWRGDCTPTLFLAPGRQSGPRVCPDHPGRRSGHLHRAPQAP